jgi:hypothetical protein
MAHLVLIGAMLCKVVVLMLLPTCLFYFVLDTLVVMSHVFSCSAHVGFFSRISFNLGFIGIGAHRRRNGSGPGGKCAHMPVGTNSHLHVVGVGNSIAVLCMVR